MGNINNTKNRKRLSKRLIALLAVFVMLLSTVSAVRLAEAEEITGSDSGDAVEVSAQEEPQQENPQDGYVPSAGGSITAECDEYKVTVDFGAEAAIPEGAFLTTQEIRQGTSEDSEYESKAADQVYENTASLPYARFFDITICAPDGTPVEPAAPVSVDIDLKDNALSTADVDFAAVHFENENAPAEVIEVDTQDTASFEAESFSVYGIIYYYTVDFYYTVSEGVVNDYHLDGGGSMMLSVLFANLGIDKGTDAITELEFTDPSLVAFTNQGTDYLIESLQPFTSSETLTITFDDGDILTINVEDAYVTSWGMGNGNALAVLDDAPGGGKYKLIIRANNAGGGAGGTAVIQNKTISNAASWGWNNAGYSDKIVEVEIAAKITVAGGQSLAHMFSGMTNLEKITINTTTSPNPGSFDSAGAGNMASMFKDCKKLDLEKGDTRSFIENLNTDNVADFSSIFNGSFTDASLSAEAKVLNLGNWTNNRKASNMQNMFKESGLTSVTLNNVNFKTRPYANGGCQIAAMFYNANSLEYINMSNITLTGRWENTSQEKGHDQSKEAGAILSVNRNGLPNLQTVIMNNTIFEDMGDFHGMFSNCPKLTKVEMKSNTPGNMAPQAIYMAYMFENSFITPQLTAETPKAILDLSGFGKLDHIVNMTGLVSGCTGLQILNISNLDNSRIKPIRSAYPADHPAYVEEQVVNPIHAMNVDWGRELGIETCTDIGGGSLEWIIAGNSKVWMTTSQHGNPGKEYYNAQNDASTYYFTKNQIDYYTGTVDPENPGDAVTTLETKREYIDVMTDREIADPGNKNVEFSINQQVNDQLPSDAQKAQPGAGLLPAGSYHLLDAGWAKVDIPSQKTYYRIGYMEGENYSKPTVKIDPSVAEQLVHDTANGRIDTTTMAVGAWGSGEYKIGDGISDIITIVYPAAAVDINGKYHDVIVRIKKVTFTKLSSIDTTTTSETVRDHDNNRYVMIDGVPSHPELRHRQAGVYELYLHKQQQPPDHAQGRLRHRDRFRYRNKGFPSEHVRAVLYGRPGCFRKPVI